MSGHQTKICRPGPEPRTVLTSNGNLVHIPGDWDLLEPGDATITRRVKAAGPSWTMQEKRGRRVFSRGVWAPAEIISRISREVKAHRETPAYTAEVRQRERQREKTQAKYVEDFRREIINFLDFAPRYQHTAALLADLVSAHATPIGSGTVARTQRIPVERRAEAAVIAWMRHQTTAYDHMSVPRVKGARRELRRRLAKRSREILQHYRDGNDPDPQCPLRETLANASRPPSPPSPRKKGGAWGKSFEDFLED